MERQARKIGVKYSLVRPTDPPPAMSEHEAKKHIEEAKAFFKAKAPFISNWNDSVEAYHTEQLTYDGHSALYYVASMAGLNRSTASLRRAEFEAFSLDALSITNQQKADNPAVIFEADIVYPGGEANMAIFVTDSGQQMVVANLDWLFAALLRIEDLVWSGKAEVDNWLQRGPITEEDSTGFEAFIEHNAQFAFAAYRTALEFALNHNVPIALDM